MGIPILEFPQNPKWAGRQNFPKAVTPCAEGKQDFAVNVNTDGSYNVVVQGEVWLKSAPTFFTSDSKVFTTADGSLKLVKNTQSSGVDFIGQWQSSSFLYQAGTSQIESSFVQYTPDKSIFTYNNPAIPFMLFKQRYINGANNTATNGNYTISGFPGFQIQETKSSFWATFVIAA
ncbi:uncharacterized protein LOC124268493 [Haliotis rubra]|uniref:uncharacterized protein LOC124268493 n=1 Tax=Haliotis rubra TaxID=36100 RepID=UPI001EE5D29E|nr:uncharacterized protein LOC124268493 [Haliotis rubra]